MKPWQTSIYQNLIHGNRDLLKGGVKRRIAADEPHLSKVQVKWVCNFFYLVSFDGKTDLHFSREECIDKLGEPVGSFVHYFAEARLLQRLHQDFWSDQRHRIDGMGNRLKSLTEESQRRDLPEMEAMGEAWYSEMCECLKEHNPRKAHLDRSMELAKGIEDTEVLIRLIPRYYLNIGLQWGEPFERIAWIRKAVLKSFELAKRLVNSDNKTVLKEAIKLLPRLHHNVIHLGESSIAEQTAEITEELASRVGGSESWKSVMFCQLTTASSLIEAGYAERADSSIGKCITTLNTKRIPKNLKTSFHAEVVLLRLRLLEKQERYFEFTTLFGQQDTNVMIQPDFILKALTMAVRVAYEHQHDEFMQQVLPPLVGASRTMFENHSNYGSYLPGAPDPEKVFEQLTPFLIRSQLAIGQGVHEYGFEHIDGVHSGYAHMSDMKRAAEDILASGGWQTPEYFLAYAETLLALGNHFQQLGEHHSSLSKLKAAVSLGEKTTWTHDTIEARVPHVLDALSASAEAHLLCGFNDQALGELVQAERIAKAADERGQSFSAVTRARMMRCRTSVYLHQARYEEAFNLALECWSFVTTEFHEGRLGRSKIRELVKTAETIAMMLISQPSEALDIFHQLAANFDAPEIAERVEGQRAKLVFLSLEAMLNAEVGNVDDAIAACDAFDALAEKVDSERFYLGYITARTKTARAKAIGQSADVNIASKAWIEAAHAWSSNFRFGYAVERTVCYLSAAEVLVDQIEDSPENANFQEASYWSQKTIESIATMRSFVSDPLKRLGIQKRWAMAYELQAKLFHLSRGTEYFGWNLKTYLQNSEAMRCRASTDLLGAPIVAEGDCPSWLKEQYDASRTSIQGHAVAKTSGDSSSPYSLPPNWQNAFSGSGKEVALGDDDLEDRIHQLVMVQRSIEQNTFKNVTYDADLGIKDIDEIQSLLPARTAVLNFDVKEHFTTVIIFTGEGYRVRKLDDFDRSICADLAEKWRSGYQQSRDEDEVPELAAWTKPLDRVLVEVAERVLQPMLGELGDIDSLCIVPNRELHIFPWHALPIGRTSRLIDVFAVSTVPSLTILKHLAGLPEQPGDPLLMAAKRRDQQLAPMEGTGLEKLLGIPCCASGGVGFDDLVQQSQAASIWHYAGHAGHREDNPLESLLTNVTPEKSDLKLRDVCSRFSFPAMQLATISGCETAMLIPNDLDEYVSFPLAFHCAGARNVISCLWCADQFACPLFFLQFYRNLQSGLSISAAHRGAIRWLRGEGEGSLKTIGDVRHELEQSFWTHAERKSSRNAWERRFNEWVDEDQETAPFADTALWAPFTCSGLAWRYVSITPSKAVMK
ncbi:CHAT domain-containing protein [Rhodopirellula baltica]